MNNEEKILEVLESLVGKVDTLENGQKNMSGKIDALENGQKNMSDKIDALENGQKEDRKLLHSLAQKVGAIEQRQDREEQVLDLVATKVSILTKDVSDLKEGQKRLEYVQGKIEVVMEHNINSKLQVLFDGLKQHGDQLDRIEKEVARQDEVILRRIK
ncbi:MAG: hypothetical protein FIA99_08910 [Ruminiclostridium sp.]|nr:hypothetical protein [Ruminiclostridium sp.]